MAKPIDPAKSWQGFSKKSFEEKRDTVMELLGNSKEGHPLLEDVYRLVSSEAAEERDFDEVYASVLEVLETEDHEVSSAAMRKLEIVRSRLEEALARERSERPIEMAEAEEIIKIM